MGFPQASPVIFFILAAIATVHGSPVPVTETLYEQETALFDEMVQPTTYDQEELLYQSMLVQEDAPAKKAAPKAAAKKAAPKKAAPKAAKKAAAKKDTEPDSGVWNPVAIPQKKANVDHAGAIDAVKSAHGKAVIGVFKISDDRDKAEATARKTQANVMKVAETAVKKYQDKTVKESDEAQKTAATAATQVAEKETSKIHEILHPGDKDPKKKAKAEKDSTFIKEVSEESMGVSPGALVGGNSDEYQPKSVGAVVVKTGDEAKAAAKPAAKAAPAAKKAAKKEAKKGKMLELVSLPTPEDFSSEEVSPTAEDAAISQMRAEEETMQDKMTQLYDEELSA